MELHQRTPGLGAQGVDEVGNDFLAGAAFAGNQEADVEGGHPGGQLEQRLHFGAVRRGPAEESFADDGRHQHRGCRLILSAKQTGSRVSGGGRFSDGGLQAPRFSDGRDRRSKIAAFGAQVSQPAVQSNPKSSIAPTLRTLIVSVSTLSHSILAWQIQSGRSFIEQAELLNRKLPASELGSSSSRGPGRSVRRSVTNRLTGRPLIC